MRPTAAWSAMLLDVTWPSDQIEWSMPSLSRSKLVTAGLLKTLRFSFSHTRTMQRRRRRSSARVNGHGGSDRALVCTGTVAAVVVAGTRPCPCAHGWAGADNTPEKTSVAMLHHPRHLCESWPPCLLFRLAFPLNQLLLSPSHCVGSVAIASLMCTDQRKFLSSVGSIVRSSRSRGKVSSGSRHTKQQFVRIDESLQQERREKVIYFLFFSPLLLGCSSHWGKT